MTDRKLLFTGAAGRLGRWLRPRLARRFGPLRSTDVVECPPAAADDEVIVADLADRDAVERLVPGTHAIVHFGGISREDTFEKIMEANLRGTYNVMDAARRHGVDRIVFASSAHATGFTPVPEHIDGATAAHRPDTLYGVSKCFGENLGRYHVDKFGMDVACLRIGWAIPEPFNDYGRQIWLSYPDLLRLVEACLTAPRFGFAVLYGASDLERGWWSNAPYSHIGYVPADGEQARRYRDQVPPAAGEAIAPRFHGGDFPMLGWRDRDYVHRYSPPPPEVARLAAAAQAAPIEDDAARPAAAKAPMKTTGAKTKGAKTKGAKTRGAGR
jgi:uronate dehydrogenase